MNRALAALALAFALPIALSACHLPDTSGANDEWRPKGINAANLAVMVQNPADLVRGRGDSGPDRKTSAKAVSDLWNSSPTALPQGAASPGGATPGGGAGAGGAGSGGAGGGAAAGAAPSGSSN